MLEQFARRRAYVLERIERLPGVTCVPPGGAFYAFMNVSEHFGRTLGGRPITDSTVVLPRRPWPRPTWRW